MIPRALPRQQPGPQAARRSPGSTSRPALLLIGLVMLVPLALGIGYLSAEFNAPPRHGGFVGLANFRDLLGDPRFWRALRNTLFWTVEPRCPPVLLGLGLALLLNRRSRASGCAGAGVPALGGADLPDRPHLAWLFNPVIGPFPPALLCAGWIRAPYNILGNPDTALWGPILANVWYGVPFFAITLLAALLDPVRALRGGRDRRRLGLAALHQDHAALPRADDRHHGDAAHDLDRQLRRPDLRDDRRRPGQLHADPVELHLHHRLQAARLRLRLGHRRAAAVLLLYAAALGRCGRG